MDEKHTYAKGFLLDTICILMGGRAAEMLVLGMQTTGAGKRHREGL